MIEKQLHGHLIGKPGGRAELNTPALIIDRAILRRNIDRMADFARDAGITLRPHAKTHKSLDIARLQLEAGAIGICCAKLGEAEALTGSGEIGDVLITSPVVSDPPIARLGELNRRIGRLTVVVDHPENIEKLGVAFDRDAPLELLIDIDPGIRRTGVASPEAAIEAATAIAAHSSLRLAGVQFYCGIQQHIKSYEERRAAIAERTDYLKRVIAALTDAGHRIGTVSGGGTGTHRIDAQLGVFTELQVGSYVAMDRQYDACEIAEDSENFETAVFVDARIVSASHRGMATLDSGFKSLSTDADMPLVVGGGAPRDASFLFMGDEHGALVKTDHDFPLGEVVTLQVPHCDPTINLYDAYHVVEGDMLVDIWPVAARGRSR